MADGGKDFFLFLNFFQCEETKYNYIGRAFRGTSIEQDGRFSDKDKRLLKKMTFPPSFLTKVDLKKVTTFPQILNFSK
jgi:hypothetical protein